MHCKGFDPFINDDSEILILGSFPSVKSRETNFYYGHPQNRFWRVLGGIFSFVPTTLEEKKKLLTENKIALWDIVIECDIEGSMDKSIKNPVIADINSIISTHNFKKILCNGKTSFRLFADNFPQYLNITTCLPSTSPANGRFSLTPWQNAF